MESTRADIDEYVPSMFHMPRSVRHLDVDVPSWELRLIEKHYIQHACLRRRPRRGDEHERETAKSPSGSSTPLHSVISDTAPSCSAQRNITYQGRFGGQPSRSGSGDIISRCRRRRASPGAVRPSPFPGLGQGFHSLTSPLRRPSAGRLVSPYGEPPLARQNQILSVRRAAAVIGRGRPRVAAFRDRRRRLPVALSTTNCPGRARSITGYHTSALPPGSHELVRPGAVLAMPLKAPGTTSVVRTPR